MIIYEPTITYNKKEIAGVLMDDKEVAAEQFRKYFSDNNLNPMQEHVMVAFLNRKNYLTSIKTLFVGGLNTCATDTKTILKEALLNNASAIIISHNHPSGNPEPSAQDTKMTRQLREASLVMDIALLDHIILGEKENDNNGMGYYSYREVGLI